MGKKSKKPSKQAPKPKAPPAVPPAEAVPRESAQIYSAHKTISVYQGTEDGVATFGVATYLRYAKADAEQSRGAAARPPSLPLAEADRAHGPAERERGGGHFLRRRLAHGRRPRRARVAADAVTWRGLRLGTGTSLPEARACHGGRGEGADRAVVPEGAGTWISVGRAAAGADLRAVQAGQAPPAPLVHGPRALGKQTRPHGAPSLYAGAAPRP